MSLQTILLLFIYVNFKYYSTTNPKNNVINIKINIALVPVWVDVVN